MSKKPTKLDVRYVNARARLDEADAAVRQASRAHLDELMKLPPRRRFAHLEDAALTSEDRKSLRRSLAALLPPPRVRLSGRLPIRIAWHRLGRRLPALIISVLALAPVIVWAVMTWQNSGEMYPVGQPLRVEWHLPSGEIKPLVIASGRTVVLVHHPITGAYFRFWIKGQGYAKAKVHYFDRSE
jgi:hypothetical protein